MSALGGITQRALSVFALLLMITFTPLAGAARSSSLSPLSYLLQIDDVRVLLDCGSPDWCPELGESDGEFYWETYCTALREYVPYH